MWRLLRGKKRHDRTPEGAHRRDDALAAMAEAHRASSARAVEPSAEEAPPPAGESRTDDLAADSAPGSERQQREQDAAAQDPRVSNSYDVVVEQHLDEVGAGIAPEQDEDDLPRQPRVHRPLSREDLVADALDLWAQQITGGITAPSFLTQMRGGGVALDLTHSHPSGLAQLLAGRGATRLSSLVREVGALADARAHARTIREIAERHAEEVGLTTCHLGIGEATWVPEDGSEPIHAPVLVRPITLRLRGSAREDVDLEIDATADLNPVLLRSLREAGVAVDARALLATTDSSHGFDPTPVLDAFRALGQPLPGFRISHALVVGNLMDAAGSVAEDLAADQLDWVASPVVAALSGDEAARDEVLQDAATEVPEVAEEELAAAVDPDHRIVLDRVLAGHDLAVATPPGSDSLGLVMDLVQELNARGHSALVVSQRRRSLAQLVAIAEQRGIEELVFDLSPDPSLQRNASAALLRSLRRAGTHGVGADAGAAELAELARAREILVGHVEAMHRLQSPWNASAHDAISALAALTRLRPAPRTTVRLRADAAARMVGEERRRYAVSLREAAEAGVLTAGPEESAWYGAPISSDTQAQRAEELLDQLRDDALPQLRRAVSASGEAIGLVPVTTVKQLTARLALLDRVQALLAVFQPAVFSADLADLVAATADKSWRAEHGVTMGWGLRRRLRKEASSLQRPASLSPDLHRDLSGARRVREDWTREAAGAGSRPKLPTNLDSVHSAVTRVERIFDELGVLLEGTATGEDLARTELDDLQQRLDALDRDREDLTFVPRRTELLRRLELDGLGELVEDLRLRRVGTDQVGPELELSWWRSVLELIAGAEPTISEYDGTSLSQVAERFRRLDAQHLAGASARVHAAADELRVSTMKSYPDTSRAAIAELARSSTVSIRDLAAKYEDILFHARPSWLASPYLVPQVVPRGRHFDVVIVADGGRLPTAAALPSIGRAKQTVVVGDPLEYGGDSAPSLLDDFLRIAPHVEIRRDHRPATEGLRTFAQRRALVGEVLAVPSPTAPEQDRLVVVEGGSGPVTEGMEYIESTEAELRRVTDLVIEHARSRPERSLAVLTFTEEHARRLMERIMNTVSVIPDLRGFFDPGAQEVFTVVPAAQASSVTRDDIIVSIGFGKTPHGRLLHRFGPLSEAGGRKALATVITRARGRTTVVSSLDVEDLDPSRLRSVGAHDLRAMLWVLRGGPDVPVIAHVADLTGQGSEAQRDPEPPRDAPRFPSADHPTGAAESGPAEQAPAPQETDEEMSDEAVDAAIDEALARKASDGTVASEPEPSAGPAPAADPALAAEPEASQQSDASTDQTPSREPGSSAEPAPSAQPPPADGSASSAGSAVSAGTPTSPSSPATAHDPAPEHGLATEPGTSTEPGTEPATSTEPGAGTEPDPTPRADGQDAEAGGQDAEAGGQDAEADGHDAELTPDGSDPDPAGGTGAAARRELETDALVRDLADRLWRLGLLVESDFGMTSDRIELALGHPDLPGHLLLAVDTDGARYVETASQRERDRLRAERLEAAGWATERVWSWALFIDPDGEAERIRRAVERALRLVQAEERSDSPTGVGTIRHRLPRPQIPAGHPLSFYSSEDFDAVVEYICSDGRARLEEHLATEVRSFLGFEQRSVLLDVSVSSAIRRYQERQ